MYLVTQVHLWVGTYCWLRSVVVLIYRIVKRPRDQCAHASVTALNHSISTSIRRTYRQIIFQWRNLKRQRDQGYVGLGMFRVNSTYQTKRSSRSLRLSPTGAAVAISWSGLLQLNRCGSVLPYHWFQAPCSYCTYRAIYFSLSTVLLIRVVGVVRHIYAYSSLLLMFHTTNSRYDWPLSIFPIFFWVAPS